MGLRSGAINVILASYGLLLLLLPVRLLSRVRSTWAGCDRRAEAAVKHKLAFSLPAGISQSERNALSKVMRRVLWASALRLAQPPTCARQPCRLFSSAGLARPWEILGIDEKADDKAIKVAYRKLGKRPGRAAQQLALCLALTPHQREGAFKRSSTAQSSAVAPHRRARLLSAHWCAHTERCDASFFNASFFNPDH